MRKYFLNIAISLDQLANAVIFLGDPDTTISARLAYNYHDTWMMKTVDWIFLILFNDKDHCLVSLGNELNYYFNKNAIIN